MAKEEQKKLLTEIMDADSKDGLYKQQTALEFIPYQEALELKELGFDEGCFGYYHEDGSISFTGVTIQNTNSFWLASPNKIFTAPLYQQAFRWFRDKYEAQVAVLPYSNKVQVAIRCERQVTDLDSFYTYEEAELACLNKLIEIVKNK